MVSYNKLRIFYFKKKKKNFILVIQKFYIKIYIQKLNNMKNVNYINKNYNYNKNILKFLSDFYIYLILFFLK